MSLPKLKKFSQNFLNDPSIISNVVDLVDVQQGEAIFEVGPGAGALTREMQKRGANVIALEKDHRLVERYGWIEGDILFYDLDDLSRLTFSDSPCKLVSSVPYAISTPFIERLLPRRDLFTSLTLILQKEFVERMLGKPMSPLTHFCQFYAEAKFGFLIPKKYFSPPPKVDSAVIQLIPKKPPEVDPKRFFKLVEKAFQQKRKTIGKTVGKEPVEKVGLDPNLRPEQLSFNDFKRLTLLMQK